MDYDAIRVIKRILEDCMMLVDASREKQVNDQREKQVNVKYIVQKLSRFLVVCYATLHPALSVRPSVGPSVTLYFFWVFAVFGLTAPAQMIW